METKEAKTTVLVSLLALAGLAVIFLPTYAGDLEPIARPEPNKYTLQGIQKTVSIARAEPNKYTRQDAYKVEFHRDDLITKATLEEDCGAAEAEGYSESFSFDEAFMNALHALPEDTTPVYPDKMTVVRVVDIGVRFGGFAGFNHMYVRVRQEADPACLNSKKKQEAEPGAEEELRKRRGELKKPPGREMESTN